MFRQMADEFTIAALYWIKTFTKKVKEKVWMMKLIELLNEYRKEKGERSLNEFEVSQTLDSLNYLRLFIKWLLSNQKIDQEKLDHSLGNCSYINNDLAWSCIKLTMYLAIQDKPIEFLVSILK